MKEDIELGFSPVAITNNAKRWSNYFEERATEVETDRSLLIAKVFGRIKPAIYDIIKEEFEEALTKAPEYQRSALKEPLSAGLTSDILVKVTVDGIVYFNSEEVLGDSSDLWDGIEAARISLGEDNPNSGKGSIAQRAKYWANIVWPAEEGIWKDTIDLRYTGWEGLAPFWLFLEHGNSSPAFPKHSATNFMFKAEERANALMRITLSEEELAYSNMVDSAAERYMIDPEYMTPGTVLEEFYKEGRKYVSYVTPTRRIGVALETSYKRMTR